jgi:hypothetical protein
LWFSTLSAFRLGFRELNAGNWLARVQARGCGLQAVGWVRVVAGLQSPLSVYLRLGEPVPSGGSSSSRFSRSSIDSSRSRKHAFSPGSRSSSST